MEIKDQDALRLMIGEVLDSKLSPIKTDIDSIKTKLNNHVEHFAYQFTEVKNDVNWLKKFFDPEGNISRDTKSNAEIGWLKWAVRFIIAGIVMEAIAMAFHLLSNN